ncbi:hypothetical protein EBB07_21180 [Paenibacillaceae bacterium]|nr:hypothetical protein EBB07_21180 [Paenibacillaceae bacterium]
MVLTLHSAALLPIVDAKRLAALFQVQRGYRLRVFFAWQALQLTNQAFDILCIQTLDCVTFYIWDFIPYKAGVAIFCL